MEIMLEIIGYGLLFIGAIMILVYIVAVMGKIIEEGKKK